MYSPHFSEQEVVNFVEYKILANEATEDEEDLYLDYVWNGTLNTESKTYYKLIKEMIHINLNGI